jgi:hypothetical protein
MGYWFYKTTITVTCMTLELRRAAVANLLAASVILLLSQAADATTTGGNSMGDPQVADPSTSVRALQSARPQLMFEPNVGQIETDEGDYIARAAHSTLTLRSSGFTMLVAAASESRSTRATDGAVATLHVRLLGARSGVQPEAKDPLRCRVNDYRGSDPRDWHLHIRTYGRVEYPNIYNGIDVAYHGAQSGFEYDFRVAPGTDPHVVRLEFDGAEALQLGPDGELIASVRGNQVIHRRPIAYQDIDGLRKQVEVAYDIDSHNRVGFVVGSYDRSNTLTIDPLAYSVFYGQNDAAHHVAVDAAGNAYVAGQRTTPVPNTDATVEKFGPDGTLLWHAEFHGNGSHDRTDVANGIAVDSAGANIFVVGTTSSDDFPVTPSAFSGTCGGPTGAGSCATHSDGFVMKLSASDGSLGYSSFIGGAFNETANAVAVDSGGFVYVTGSEASLATKGQSHANHSSSGSCTLDAYLAKFDMSQSGANSLVFAVPIGGDGDDVGNALAIAPGRVLTFGPCTRFPCPATPVGTIYVAGTTGATCAAGMGNSLFPTTAGGLSSDVDQLPHAFIVLLDTSGSRLFYSSVLPASSALGVAIAAPTTSSAHRLQGGFSDAVITGMTADVGQSSKPVFQPKFGLGDSDAYAAKIDPTKVGAASLVFFTYLGGSASDVGRDIAVHASGAITIVGSTNSTDFPIPHAAPWLAPVQPALVAKNCGTPFCTDAFVATLTADGKSEAYATYLGGSSDDSAMGVAVCDAGPCQNSIFLVGQTSSTDFPVTTGAFSLGPDAFVSKIAFTSRPRIGRPAGGVPP